MPSTLLNQSPETRPGGCAPGSENKMKIRTLLVDDQPSALAVLKDILHFEPDIQIIGTASNGRDAIEAINPRLTVLESSPASGLKKSQ